MHAIRHFAFLLFTSGAFVACGQSSSGLPATEAGAKQLLQQFLTPGADHAALSKALRPTAADYAAVYGTDAAAKLDQAYAPAWDAGQLVVAPNEGQTELKMWKATSEELKAGTGEAAGFPGGYKEIASKLQPGQTLYRFKFTKPGEELGMAYDGLVHVNGHWVLIPKPWRALGGG